MISVGFSTKLRNPISMAIRAATDSEFSHTWVRYAHPFYRRDMVVDAGLGGIVEVPYDIYVPTLDDVVELEPPVGLEVRRAFEELGRSMGLPYDEASLLGRLWVKIMAWFGRKVKNPLRNPRRDCCVENVYRFVFALHSPKGELVAAFRDVDPEDEAPSDLYARLLALGWKPVGAARLKARLQHKLGCAQVAMQLVAAT